ncbi:hypothetical protein N7520_007751 [Penicillium odoratum]|uniref:uncharacterized protein n=1 Tax=Penicillium odoratum TaxID=1167516 RepID=UPI0025496333|nr:uncharacterized protein N7520_007751 [Penicillium odoratum]KAJ5760595.1 hypothetical protein N7520_007751 [Penicillium odoratum]
MSPDDSTTEPLGEEEQDAQLSFPAKVKTGSIEADFPAKEPTITEQPIAESHLINESGKEINVPTLELNIRVKASDAQVPTKLPAEPQILNATLETTSMEVYVPAEEPIITKKVLADSQETVDPARNSGMKANVTVQESNIGVKPEDTTTDAQVPSELLAKAQMSNFIPEAKASLQGSDSTEVQAHTTVTSSLKLEPPSPEILGKVKALPEPKTTKSEAPVQKEDPTSSKSLETPKSQGKGKGKAAITPGSTKSLPSAEKDESTQSKPKGWRKPALRKPALSKEQLEPPEIAKTNRSTQNQPTRRSRKSALLKELEDSREIIRPPEIAQPEASLKHPLRAKPGALTKSKVTANFEATAKNMVAKKPEEVEMPGMTRAFSHAKGNFMSNATEDWNSGSADTLSEGGKSAKCKTSMSKPEPAPKEATSKRKAATQAPKSAKSRAAVKTWTPATTGSSSDLSDAPEDDEEPAKSKASASATTPTPKKTPGKGRPVAQAPEEAKSKASEKGKGPSFAKEVTHIEEQGSDTPNPNTRKSAMKRKASALWESASSCPSTKRRKVSFQLHEAISLNPDHPIAQELKHIMELVSEAAKIEKELDTPEANVVLKRLTERDRIIAVIEHLKDILSKGIYMQPKNIQNVLLDAYRENLGEDPFPRICETDFDSDDADPPTPTYSKTRD